MLLFLYTVLNFISATLIFFIQPLAAKTILPILGGAPYVWNGCMVFFQAVLLLGYIYAHVLNNYASPRNNVLLHLGLFLLMAILTLPLNISGLTSGGAEASQPLIWLIGSLFIVLGLPFFLISATSPLTQSWFARTRSKWQEKPYMLYAASNLGSFFGLMAYPLIFEPYFNNAVQVNFIHFGFVALFILLAACAFYLLKRPHVVLKTVEKPEYITGLQKFKWIFMAFVPSGLLYAVTMHITTDIASFPLLWILPLGLYILSFVLVFSENGKFLGKSKILHFAFAMTLLMQMAVHVNATAVMVIVILVLFFVFCMICHGKLYDERPQQYKNLTRFYIYTSLGGVLGGLFNTFLAPQIFNSVAEFPLLIILSLFVWLKKDDLIPDKLFKNLIRPLLIIGAAVLVIGLLVYLNNYYGFIQSLSGEGQGKVMRMMIGILTIFAILMTITHIKNTLIAIALVLLFYYPSSGISLSGLPGEIIFQERNIFGVNRVTHNNETSLRSFLHGTTIHGVQTQNDKDDLLTISYYYPLKEVIAVTNYEYPIATLGQGVGVVACYAKPEQVMDFYEIDELVSEIADKYFTYMNKCPGKKNLIIGDGRINISRQPDGKYGLIILDAFSSDSIPIHLVTQEAMYIYASKLKDNGIIAANISNRYLNLAPVFSTLANSMGYSILLLDYNPPKNAPRDVVRSIWVVLAKNQETLEPLLAKEEGWKKLDVHDPKHLWKDNYSNILHSIIW